MQRPPDILNKAREYLLHTLAGGPTPANVVEEHARQSGISQRSLQRARQELGVLSRRSGFGSQGVWSLSLPGEPPQQNAARPERLCSTMPTLPRSRSVSNPVLFSRDRAPVLRQLSSMSLPSGRLQSLGNLMPVPRRGLFNQGMPVRRFRWPEN